MKKLIALLLCFQTGYLIAQVPLIPRMELFDSREWLGFKLNETGDRCYFQRVDRNAVIYSFDVKGDRELDSLVFPHPVAAWEPVPNGMLAALAGEEQTILGLLSEQGKWQALPGGSVEGRIRFLRADAKGNLAVNVSATDPDASGIFVVDPVSLSWVRKYPSQEINTLFLDANLELVAGQHTNEFGALTFSVYNRKTGSWEDFLEHEWSMDNLIGGFSRIISVSNDGTEVFFTSNHASDKCRLYCYHQPSGEMKELAADPKVDLLPFGASVGPDGRVFAVVGLFAKSIRKVMDIRAREDFDLLAKSIRGDISFGGVYDQNRKWLIRELSGGPMKLYLFDRTTKELTYLASDFPDLAKKKLAQRHAHSVTATDGLELPVHVYLPPGTDPDGDGIPDRPLPTVLYVHGGPWVGVFHWNQYFHWRNFQLLANRGYAVINCEFRGSTGLGKAFTEASRLKWGSDMTRDKTDIARWAVSAGISDQQRLAIWGWSYGGYATMAGLSFSPDTYACGISMYAPVDLPEFCKIPFADNPIWRNWVGNIQTESGEELLEAHSPYHHAENIKAPILMTTGSRDDRIPQEQMDRLAMKLDRLGKDVIYLRYPEEGHDYRAPESWISFWAVGEKFLADHLGGRFESGKKDLRSGNFEVIHGNKYVDDIANTP